MANESPRHSVLVVEDSPDERTIIRAALSEHCDLTETDDLAKARDALKVGLFSLILLDRNLPDGDGFSFCKELRSKEEFQHIPVIFLTARSAVDDRVAGFEIGADDYVIKPFEPMEFLARVQAKLKRSIGFQKVFVHGPFHVDVSTQRISLLKGEGAKEQLNLTPIESKLMIHFLQNENRVFSREELVQTIWGESTHISSHTVDSHISSLRKKIGESGKCLRAVQKQGYCFDRRTNKVKP